MSETAGRALLAARFRAFGFRIVHDVPLVVGAIDVTLDGFDPERRVGFEYIAAAERDSDVSASERTALGTLAGYRILVVDAMDAAELETVITRFLSTLEPPRKRSGRRHRRR